jgi:predicted nucleotidyltransferase
MRAPGIEVARSVVDDKFRECQVAFLSGSASRGEETETSDLDIVIFTKDESYRESLVQQDWTIELFVHNETSYLEQFESFRLVFVDAKPAKLEGVDDVVNATEVGGLIVNNVSGVCLEWERHMPDY